LKKKKLKEKTAYPIPYLLPTIPTALEPLTTCLHFSLSTFATQPSKTLEFGKFSKRKVFDCEECTKEGLLEALIVEDHQVIFRVSKIEVARNVAFIFFMGLLGFKSTCRCTI